MAKELACPGHGDKVGLKIDYLSRLLGQSLAAQGFKRKGRNLLREAGDGVDRHWQIINFQSGEWNSGASGEFYVNLALQFPAIQRVEAARPGKAWMQELLDKVGEEHGQLRERLQNLVPVGHRLAGSEIKIAPDEDLPALAAALVEATAQWALPWFAAHASVAAVRDFDGSIITADADVRIAAALALNDSASAERLLRKHQGRWESVQASYIQSLRDWLEPAGVNCSCLPAPGQQPKKDSWALRREAEAAAEDAGHEAQAAELTAQLDTHGLEPALLAAAWLAEWRARRRQDPKPLVDLPSGARVAALDAAGREAVLLALLQSLVAIEAQAKRDSLHPKPEEFATDEAVAVLLQAVLPTLEAPRQPATLFDALRALQARLRQDLVTAQYPWGFARLATWLARQPQDAALRIGMESWLQGLRVLMPARHEATEQSLAAYYSRPLDPAAFNYASQLEQRASYEAQLAAQDRPATLARLAAYPEQSLAPDDKAAVRAWRRWLRRDPSTGLLPVHCEGDDWGGPTIAAWQTLDAALRQALEPVLQAWLETGVEAKPRALKALGAQVAALPAEHRGPWQAWVLDRLRWFEHSSGATEWATTRMRPGVGVVLGEDSENLLLGLMLWSWADRGLPDAALVPVWRTLTEAAWLRLPNHGARAPTVGRLGLRLLAGLGGAAREFVQSCADAKGEKQLAKVAAQALAEPLPRP
ncbi:DUF4304 domain-containing protein [Roseateles sp. NT4]|uniref:DUF4304 domain-containing protein n=1 Tax=Roseateles sp. NT4 TaxID=3453715 RepID=UPI003EEB9274